MTAAGRPQWLYTFAAGKRPELLDGEGWTEADEQVAGRHQAHLAAALDRGELILAGRSQDWVGPAVVVFEADDEERARAFMESDPFVSEGLFTATLHPFRAAYLRST